jgi:3-phosphoshikimate 1-carboxyvinyltransferase
MSQRPVKILVESLREIGADIQFLENAGHLPLFIKGRNLISRDVSVDGSESSQHVSAVLLIATAISGGLNILLENSVVSRPYIQMTCKVLEQCGFSAIWQEELIRVFPGKEMSVDIEVETDWSSVSFWYGMLALADEGELLFPGLKRTGMQGDEIATELFSLLGVKTVEKSEGIYITKGEVTSGPVEWDFRDCPDLAVPFIISCALLGKRAVFSGLEGLRIKESDRIESLQTELRKLNSDLTPDYVGLWHLKPAKTKKKQIQVDSHADHRIGMAMTMITLKDIVMEITDPEIVSKSYPGFWRDMKQAGFRIKE